MLLQPLLNPDSEDRREVLENAPCARSAPDAEPVRAAGDRESKRKLRRRRLAWLIGSILAASVLLLVIVVGVMLFLARDTSSPYRVGQALEQFRLVQRRDDIGAGQGKDLPITGVYVYSTEGSESASAPGLPASTAQYPVTTTMTVFSQGCGQDWRWQPLTDRYEDLVVCRSPNGSLMLQSRFDSVEFYRNADRRNFACTDDSVFLPAHPRAGQVFAGTCSNAGNSNSGGLRIDYQGRVVGDDVLEIGGVSVNTVHLVVHEQMRGDTLGTGAESVWLDAGTGLVVKLTRIEATRSQSAVGWVPSTESFSIELRSLLPKT